MAVHYRTFHKNAGPKATLLQVECSSRNRTRSLSSCTIEEYPETSRQIPMRTRPQRNRYGACFETEPKTPDNIIIMNQPSNCDGFWRAENVERHFLVKKPQRFGYQYGTTRITQASSLRLASIRRCSQC